MPPRARRARPFTTEIGIDGSKATRGGFVNGPNRGTLAAGRLSLRIMAKRKSPDLFDNLEPAGGAPPPPTGGGPGSTANVALHEAAQSRYSNYALSVITVGGRCRTCATA